MKYHFVPPRMTIIKINKQVLASMWKKENTCALLVGMQTGAATVESNMELPQKIKNGTAFCPNNSTSGNNI